MWLYVYSNNKEFSYNIKDNHEKVFLKDLSLYYEKGANFRNDIGVQEIKEASILYKSGKARHKILKPSYCLMIIPIILIAFLTYALLIKF